MSNLSAHAGFGWNVSPFRLTLQTEGSPMPPETSPAPLLPATNGSGDVLGVSNGSSLFAFGAHIEESWMTEEVLQQIRYEFFTHKQTPTMVLITLYSISFLLGLVGNLLVIYIFARNRRMRTVTNSFLVNLAVCDLLVVCLCMPFTVASEIYNNWIYGDPMCKIVNFGQGLAVASSILTLTVISAERFYAIRRPLRARAFMSRTRIQRIAIGIWLLAAIAVLPCVFIRENKVVEQIFTVTIISCIEQWHSIELKHAYNFALLLILYIAPVAFICIGYLKIGLNLWRTETMLHAGTRAAESANARANLNGRRKVAKMLFVMALLFALSWLPISIYSILLDFMPEQTLRGHGVKLRHWHSFFLWLGHTNSTINPVCYCIMSTSFKAAIRSELRRCCSCMKGVHWRRESFRSMSISMTGSTSTGATASVARATPLGGTGGSGSSGGSGGRVSSFSTGGRSSQRYTPVATGNGYAPDLSKCVERYKVDYV